MRFRPIPRPPTATSVWLSEKFPEAQETGSPALLHPCFSLSESASGRSISILEDLGLRAPWFSKGGSTLTFSDPSVRCTWPLLTNLPELLPFVIICGTQVGYGSAFRL